VIQRLLSQGARQARLEYAARLYGNGEVTLERAAELAGVTIYDMMAHVRSRNIMPPSDVAELRADVADTLARLGHSDLAERVRVDGLQ
jgi:predicted HTH domain antitoxin